MAERERGAHQQVIGEVTLYQWMSGSVPVFQDHPGVGQKMDLLQKASWP